MARQAILERRLGSKPADPLLHALAEAIAKLETHEQILGFCREFLSGPEIKDLTVRWQVFCSTMRGHPVRKVAEECAVSNYKAGRARHQLGREARVSAMIFEKCFPGETFRLNGPKPKEM